MKKSLLLGLSTLALIGTATVSHARMNDNSWYVGAGASWIGTNETNKLSLETDQNDTGISKIGLEDKSAFGGTLLVGYNVSDNTFVDFGYGFDSTSAKGSKLIYDDNAESTDTTATLGRLHTYSLGFGVNKELTHSLDVYLKFSALFSQFNIENKTVDIVNTAQDGHASTKKWAWGWAPTIGLSKDLGNCLTIKADYSYQMYGRIKQGMDTNPGAETALTLNLSLIHI